MAAVPKHIQNERWGCSDDRDYSRFPPPTAEEITSGALTGLAGAAFGPPGLLAATLFVSFAWWAIDRIRALEDNLEERIDLEDVRKALAEVETAGTITWEEIKKRNGLVDAAVSP